DHATVHLLDIRKAKEVATLPALANIEGPTMLSASSDGRWLAVAWRNQASTDPAEAKLAVYDVASHRRRFLVTGLPLVPGSVAINGDGSLVAISGGDEGRSEIRDGATGALQLEVKAIPRPQDAHLFVNTSAVLF